MAVRRTASWFPLSPINGFLDVPQQTDILFVVCPALLPHIQLWHSNARALTGMVKAGSMSGKIHWCKYPWLRKSYMS